MAKKFPGHPLFDTSDKLAQQVDRLVDYPTLQYFLSTLPDRALDDWKVTAAFLLRHTATSGTYSKFRGEIQRFLNFVWIVRGKTLSELRGDDIDSYMDFVKSPPVSWCTTKSTGSLQGEGRQRGFVTKNGSRVANVKWRPFYDAGSRRKPATMNSVVASLSIFFKKLVVSEYLPRSPMADATRRLQKASKSENSAGKKGLAVSRKKRTTAPRLTAWQWSYILETLIKAADENPRYERNLFLVITMKALYLRVFELAPHGERDTPDYIEPVMGDFARTTVGNKSYWELHVCGKGEKDRWIPLPDEYLHYLKRYRKFRNLTPLPSPGEPSPMVTRLNSDKAITNKRQLENIVEESIMLAVARMEKENLQEAKDELKQMAKKTHILRHTGASMDLENGRPLRDVSEDLGHESAAFTEEVYIDADLTRRYETGTKRSIH